MTDFKLLEKLCTVEGISGDEGSVREIIINEIKPFADEIKTDNLGNIIVFKKGKNRAKTKLMLSAHMDEVGFMVTDITSDGYLKFDEVGGIDTAYSRLPSCDGVGMALYNRLIRAAGYEVIDLEKI